MQNVSTNWGSLLCFTNYNGCVIQSCIVVYAENIISIIMLEWYSLILIVGTINFLKCSIATQVLSKYCIWRAMSQSGILFPSVHVLKAMALFADTFK